MSAAAVERAAGPGPQSRRDGPPPGGGPGGPGPANGAGGAGRGPIPFPTAARHGSARAHRARSRQGPDGPPLPGRPGMRRTSLGPPPHTTPRPRAPSRCAPESHDEGTKLHYKSPTAE